jgi:hypothetical protein
MLLVKGVGAPRVDLAGTITLLDGTEIRVRLVAPRAKKDEDRLDQGCWAPTARSHREGADRAIREPGFVSEGGAVLARSSHS